MQDLIRNDVSIKSRNSSRNRDNFDDDYAKYFTGNRVAYNIQDFLLDDEQSDLWDMDDVDSDYDETSVVSSRAKFEKKYDYMYDSRKYDILLQRGLEYIEPEELQNMLGNIKEQQVCKTLKLK